MSSYTCNEALEAATALIQGGGVGTPTRNIKVLTTWVHELLSAKSPAPCFSRPQIVDDGPRVGVVIDSDCDMFSIDQLRACCVMWLRVCDRAESKEIEKAQLRTVNGLKDAP